MLIRSAPHFCFLFLFAPLLILVVPTIWFSQQSYQSLVDFIVQITERPDIRQLITSQLLTEGRFNTIYALHWLAYPLLLFITVLLIIFRSQILSTIHRVLQYLLTSFKAISNFYKTLPYKEKYITVLISIAFLILSFWKAIYRDITYDEAWNYNYFIGKPFYFSFFLFNTYPLYHAAASILATLPFDPCILSRSISILSGLFTLLLLNYWLRRFFPVPIIAILLLAAIASPLFNIYTVMAKGVALSTCLSTIQFFSLLHLCCQQWDNRHFILFSFSSIANLLTLPTTFFFATTLSACLLYTLVMKKSSKQIKAVTIFVIALLLFSLISIFPFLVSSAKQRILGTNTEESIINILAWYFSSTSTLFWSKANLNLVLLANVPLILLLCRAKREILISVLTIVATGIALIVKPLPERSLAFLFIPYLLIGGSILNVLNSFFRSRFAKSLIFTPILVFFCILLSGQTRDFFRPPNGDFSQSKRISEWMLGQNVRTCYVQHPEFWVHYPTIEYYYRRSGKSWQMKNDQHNSTRYSPFQIQESFDCIVTQNYLPDSILAFYQVMLEEKDFKIYLKKNTIGQKP